MLTLRQEPVAPDGFSDRLSSDDVYSVRKDGTQSCAECQPSGGYGGKEIRPAGSVLLTGRRCRGRWIVCHCILAQPLAQELDRIVISSRNLLFAVSCKIHPLTISQHFQPAGFRIFPRFQSHSCFPFTVTPTFLETTNHTRLPGG